MDFIYQIGACKMKPDFKQRIKKQLEGMSLFAVIDIYIFVQFKRLEFLYQKIQVRWIELMMSEDK